LYSVVWLPEHSIKAVVAFVHGHGDHCRRYDDWFAGFLDEGIAIVSFDLRGHGRSSGTRGVMIKFSDFCSDTDLLIRQTKARFPEIPVILYGHSLGATIVLNYLQTGNNLPELAIASSPWLQLIKSPGKIKSTLIRFVSKVFPNVTMKTGLRSSDFSELEDFSENREKDVLVHNLISSRFFCEVQDQAQKIMDYPGKINVPLLLMHGGEDKITNPEADRILADRSTEKITFREWRNSGHQLHKSVESKAVMNNMIKWIKDKI
jgi:alpha-beta hydrolase superfamily lysophospholipase